MKKYAALGKDNKSKENIWEELCDMEVYVWREHCIYGAPRELITYVWVWEQYVVYRQVTNSCPARYEFLWGPRETSKLKIMEHLLKVCTRDVNALPSLSEEVEGNEEMGAWVNVAARYVSGPHPASFPAEHEVRPVLSVFEESCQHSS